MSARGGELRVLAAAPLHWASGHEGLLEAQRLLLDRGLDVRCRIAGRGPHEDAVTFARHQLGLGDRASLLGPLGPDGLEEQLRWADVLVHAPVAPCATEPVMAGLVAGVPVVVSDLVETSAGRLGGSAVSVPPHRPRALADALAAFAVSRDGTWAGIGPPSNAVSRSGLHSGIAIRVMSPDLTLPLFAP